MNPYKPPDDESQLDRIERKMLVLTGGIVMFMIGVVLMALVFLLIEILGRWKF